MQISKSRPKKISILCTFKYAIYTCPQPIWPKSKINPYFTVYSSCNAKKIITRYSPNWKRSKILNCFVLSQHVYESFHKLFLTLLHIFESITEKNLLVYRQITLYVQSSHIRQCTALYSKLCKCRNSYTVEGPVDIFFYTFRKYEIYCSLIILFSRRREK